MWLFFLLLCSHTVYGAPPESEAASSPPVSPSAQATPAADETVPAPVADSAITQEYSGAHEELDEAVEAPVSVPKRRGGGGESDQGSKALGSSGRFGAETLLKSPYRINGEPLEVDPD